MDGSRGDLPPEHETSMSESVKNTNAAIVVDNLICINLCLEMFTRVRAVPWKLQL